MGRARRRVILGSHGAVHNGGLRALSRALPDELDVVRAHVLGLSWWNWPRSSTACIPNVCAVWFWPTRMPAGRDHFLSRCAGNGWRAASVTRWRHPAPLSLRCCPASSAMALLKTFRTSRRPSCLSSTRLASADVDLIRRDGHPRSPPEDSGAHAVAVGRHGSSQSGARRRATARRHSRRRACDHPEAGHLSNMEQPEVFNAHVRRFCLSRDTE